jgi:hypothetical protein
VSTSELLKRVSIKRSEQPLIFTLDIAKSDDRLSCHYYAPDILRTIIELENCNDITTIKDISTHVRYSDGKCDPTPVI